MGVYLGLDGGGTKTACRIADSARVLGEASCGTVKLMLVDEATATARLHGLLRDSAAIAGISLAEVNAACFGMAGASSDVARAWARRALGEVINGKLDVCGDVEIALDAAFGTGPGILVIAGTGSNVLGRCSDGSLHAAGGWGPVLGDEGSGHWIGVEAIRAGLRAEDRGVSTCMLREIERFWDLRNRDALVIYANASPRPEFAALAPVVAACAASGDALAASVLQRAGEELAAQVSLVASKMRHAGCAADDASRVAFTGSVLEHIAPVREAMQAASPHASVDTHAADALEGALWRARRL